MADIISLIIIFSVIVGAVLYLLRAKKRGEKCIGCPYAKQCKKENCEKNKTA